MHLKRAVCWIFFLFGFLNSTAVCQAHVDDFMRSTGKIYVVVAVLVVIFLLIIGYLIVLDRRIKKLENNLPNEENK